MSLFCLSVCTHVDSKARAKRLNSPVCGWSLPWRVIHATPCPYINPSERVGQTQKPSTFETSAIPARFTRVAETKRPLLSWLTPLTSLAHHGEYGGKTRHRNNATRRKAEGTRQSWESSSSVSHKELDAWVPFKLILRKKLHFRFIYQVVGTRDVTIPIFLELIPERFHGPKEPLIEPIPGWKGLQLWNQLQCHIEMHNMEHF